MRGIIRSSAPGVMGVVGCLLVALAVQAVSAAQGHHRALSWSTSAKIAQATDDMGAMQPNAANMPMVVGGTASE